MDKVFNWCFIGCGKLAGIVAQQLNASGRHRIVSAYTRRPEQCAAFTAAYGGTPCATAAEAIASPGVDGVYVVTPHASHFEYTKLALEMGKPVLNEKAFTVTAHETRQLIDLAKEKDLYLAEAMWIWFAPVANKIKSWLDAGAFGQITNVVLSARGDGRNYAPRVTDPAAAGGALLDMGVYAITYLYRLFGKPTSVTCKGVVADGIDREEDITLTFPAGQTYVTSVSVCDPQGKNSLLIEGAKAKIHINGFNYTNTVDLIHTDGTVEHFEGDGSYLNEFDLVVSEIRQGLKQSRWQPLQITLDVMEIMDECRRQMALVYPFEK